MKICIERHDHLLRLPGLFEDLLIERGPHPDLGYMDRVDAGRA
ncbi:hypothetical protein WMF19_11280 [Sorangium sp. So ce124]